MGEESITAETEVPQWSLNNKVEITFKLCMRDDIFNKLIFNVSLENEYFITEEKRHH